MKKLDKQKTLVFVYGTLMANERNHHLLETAKLVERSAWTFGGMYDSGNGYPVMATGDVKRVYGDLYEITNEQLKQLDLLEGYQGPGNDNHYERIVRTIYSDTDELEAYTYVYGGHQVEELCPIHSGDWKCQQYLDQPELFYFAYGSCMDHERFKERGVSHLFQDVVGKGTLDGYSLRFTFRQTDGGRADIVEDEGEVEGKVYKIGQEALQYLYDREGVGQSFQDGHYRPAFIDLTVDGEKWADVLTFIVIDKDEETAPPEHYLREILRGGHGCLSEGYLARVEMHVNRLVK